MSTTGETRKAKLSPRERLFLLDIASGLTAQQVANLNGVQLTTVNTTLSRAKVFLSASTIAHAVALAIHTGEFTTADVFGPRTPEGE